MRQSHIIISPKGKLMAMVPHYILINGQLLGIMKGKEAHISLPSGRYVLTIRSMYSYRTSAMIKSYSSFANG